MITRNKFFYDAAPEGNEGGGQTQEQQQQQEQSQPPVAPAVPLLSADELKDFGFQSGEELKAFLAKQKEANISEEEKQKKANIEKADFLKYAAENDFNLDEINQYEVVKQKADTDLVFEKFLKEYQEENPELSGEELKEAAKLEFETEYKLNSENEKAKQRGLARLEKEAKELRSPYETSYQKAQEMYKENVNMKQVFPKYEKFIDEVIAEGTPDTIKVKAKAGEEEIEIDAVELTADQKKEVEKFFKNPKTFAEYLKGGDKADELKAKIAKKIEGFIKANNFDKAVQRGLELGIGLGTKKGSNVGAENPFAVANGNKSGQTTKVVASIEESNARIAEARQRYRP